MPQQSLRRVHRPTDRRLAGFKCAAAATSGSAGVTKALEAIGRLLATYTDRATRLPVASVVVTRGTNITSDIWSDLVQAFEDLMVLSPQPLPWLSDSPVRVAEGTLDALCVIEGLQSGGVGLRDHLAGFLGNPANERPVLVLTGHSLGGCITTVAAPTAGEQRVRDLLPAVFCVCPPLREQP